MRPLFDYYAKLFCSKRWYKLNRILYLLSLRGMGILYYHSTKESGEYSFIKGLNIKDAKSKFIVFDVGANEGDYSLTIKKIYPSAQIYAFEPHPITFKRLKVASDTYGFQAYNYGLGIKGGQQVLYDHQADDTGTQHASIYKGVIEEFHNSKAQKFNVNICTLDHFIKDNNINKVNLLKIDTEGNELNVLHGATISLKNNIIDMIHFEFNGLNVISRVFMKDFFTLLPNYRFYRMLSDGLISLEYDYLMCEIFAFQNIVAIRTS